MRRFAASASIVCLAALTAPAQAFSVTQLADGSYEYFFETPSLRIESASDLDLAGLSFIEGVMSGFRVGASFALDWAGGELAWQVPDITWSGSTLTSRSLSIVSGGDLDLGSAHLILIGGSISLTAGTIQIGSGAVIDVGGGNAVVDGVPDLSGRLFPGLPPREIGAGSTLTVLPGGDISLTSPSPVPEPSTMALLLVGLLSLVEAVRRNAAR